MFNNIYSKKMMTINFVINMNKFMKISIRLVANGKIKKLKILRINNLRINSQNFMYYRSQY